ncbi:MAG: hypothetical protein EOP93_17635, partial [Lysobacteraceae bacterium]
ADTAVEPDRTRADAAAADGNDASGQAASALAAETPAMDTITAAAAPARTLRATPLARSLARDQGIDIATVQGSGPDGRVLARDLPAGAATAAADAIARASGPGAVAGTGLHLHWFSRGAAVSGTAPVVLLHGFGTSLGSWRPLSLELKDLPLVDGQIDYERIDGLHESLKALRELSDEPGFQACLTDMVVRLQGGVSVDSKRWATKLREAMQPLVQSDFQLPSAQPDAPQPAANALALTAAQATQQLGSAVQAYQPWATSDSASRQANAASLYNAIGAFVRAHDGDLQRAIDQSAFTSTVAQLRREGRTYVAQNASADSVLRFACANEANPSEPATFNFAQAVLLQRLAMALLMHVQ